MIVIADSGSTKCNWQLVDDSGSVCRVQSRGINAVLQRPDEVEALLRETFAEPVQADALHFYGAGCGERYPEQSARLREALARYFPAARIAVESDLMGAARALLGGRAGIACILGTGSNSCYYDGVRIVRNTPPLGWVLGDEGSGTYIGRQLVGNLLKGLCDESLRRLFFEEERLDYDEIIRRVYREGMANRFLASFTRFVARHIDPNSTNWSAKRSAHSCGATSRTTPPTPKCRHWAASPVISNGSCGTCSQPKGCARGGSSRPPTKDY